VLNRTWRLHSFRSVHEVRVDGATLLSPIFFPTFRIDFQNYYSFLSSITCVFFSHFFYPKILYLCHVKNKLNQARNIHPLNSKKTRNFSHHPTNNRNQSEYLLRPIPMTAKKFSETPMIIQRYSESALVGSLKRKRNFKKG
jgi:hypothetical protein